MNSLLERKTILVLLIGLCVGGVVGAVVVASTTHHTSSNIAKADVVNAATSGNDVEQRESEATSTYQFISPLLACDTGRELSTNGTLRMLKNDLTGYIDDMTKKGTISGASVYFRELNDGSWFGINESTKFTPGSLLKVPLALSILRKKEEDPAFAKGPFWYAGGAPDIAQVFPPQQTAEVEKAYTLDDLLSLSLTYSDNVATLLLAQLIDRKVLNDAYSDLGIDVPQDGDVYTVAVRTYASFFRILYNATYLSRADSEKVLLLLSKSTFTQGIVAGVPQDVMVAHKFGERERDTGVAAQLHDCGIVYKPKHPYLLCVMLRGDDIHQLPDVIANMSHTVYQDLDK